jgi:hypothetical protein
VDKIKKFLYRLFFNNYVFCSLFVGAMLWLITVIPLNEELTKPFSDALSDFEITDLGFTKLRTSDITADTNVVIVNMGKAGNAELAAIINQLNEHKPAVIGINKILQKSGNEFEDSLLLEAIKNTKQVVLAAKLHNFDEVSNTWSDIELPDSMFLVFEHDSTSVHYATVGFTNMPTNDKDFKTTRHFFPVAKLADGTQLNFFAKELVQEVAPDKVKLFESRTNEYEVINYRGNYEQFITLDAMQVLNAEFDPTSIRNKVIMIGYLGESLEDEKFWDDYKYYTPLNKNYAGKTFPDMFETVIYANIAAQIFHNDHINVASPRLDMFINILLCFINVVIFSKLYNAAAVWWDVFSLIITLVEILVILMTTVFIFSEFNFELNLNPSIIFLIILGSFLELYYGLVLIAYQKISVKYMVVSEVQKRDKLKDVLKAGSKNIIDDLKNINIDKEKGLSEDIKNNKNQLDL